MNPLSSLPMIAVLVVALLLGFPATRVLAGELNDEVKSLLVAADKLVSSGRSNYPEAIGKYTQALKLDPINTRGLYSRAELYASMKQRDKCLEDLDKLLWADPKHRQGLQLRVKLLAQAGDLIAAARDQVNIVQHFKEKGQTKKSEEALETLDKLRSFGEAWRDVEQQLRAVDPVKDFPRWRSLNSDCVRVLQGVISEFAKDLTTLRIRRAECALAAGDRMASSDELKFVVKREPQNLHAAALSATAFRMLGAMDQAKSELKRCLSLDPEFGPCMKLHKRLRQYQKHTEQVQQLVTDKDWNKVLPLVDESFVMEDGQPPNLDQLWRWRCQAHAGLRDVEKALDVCQTLLDLENGDSNPQMYDVHLIKADMFLAKDDFAAAEAAVRKAEELQPNNADVRDKKAAIERLKRQSERKDYYKILGVPKTSTSNDIRRAYRKLSKQYHPDQLRSKEMTQAERDRYDVLYRDMNEAKEVLMDEEKRRRFDNGEDVTKPPEQQGGPFHGSPFHFNFGNGGFPGGGGGHQFHFNFG